LAGWSGGGEGRGGRGERELEGRMLEFISGCFMRGQMCLANMIEEDGCVKLMRPDVTKSKWSTQRKC
jgi:hypothetical protein